MRTRVARPLIGLPSLALSLLLSLAAWASPVAASELEALRVGRHPHFTRVVFEFDSPTGYRVARVGDAQNRVIEVTLHASAEPKRVESASPLIREVRVESGTGLSVARIELRESDATFKELILGSPPRVVLDIQGDDAEMIALVERRRRGAAKPASQPEKTEKLAAKPAQPAPRAEPRSEPEPAPPEPRRREPRPTPKPAVAPEPVVPEPEPVIAESVAEVPPAKLPTGITENLPPPPPPPPAPRETAEAASDVSGPQAESEMPAPAAPESRVARAQPIDPRDVEALAGLPTPAAPAESAPGEPPSGAPTAPTGSGLLVYAAIGGVVVLALGLVLFLFLRRRRALPNDRDVAAIAEEDEAANRIPPGGFAMEAGAADAAAESASAAPSGPDPAGEPGDDLFSMPEVPSSRSASAAPAAESDMVGMPTDFDEADGEKEGEVNDLNLPTDRTESPGPPPLSEAGMGMNEDVMAVVRALEQRVAQLETRLDESVEARERLERQVAAQAEELRVQRAAIARTQRALRGLSRSEEEQATEPAIRNPA